MFLRRLFDILGLSRGGVANADVAIVGLGNVGAQYEATRHNIGFAVVEEITRTLVGPRTSRQFEADTTAATTSEGRRLLLAKPRTFVNRSGATVAAIVRTGMPVSSCLVVVDDFHLPLGALRLRPSGSDGGHNGLKSVIAEVGTGFPRLRVGVGPLPPGVSTVDFVLSRFSDSESADVRKAVAVAAQAVSSFCSKGVEATMNAFNRG